MASISIREFGRGKSAAQKENQSRHVKGLAVGNNKQQETRHPKRKVLSSISNHVRIQPSRAAKVSDGRQDENAGIPAKVFSGNPRNQHFSIYVDDDSTTLTRLHPTSSRPAVGCHYSDDTENHAPSLEDAVACLPSIPSMSHHMGTSEEGCFLDMSGIEEDDVEIVEDEDEDKDESDEHNVSMTPLDQPMACVPREQRILSKVEREAFIEEVAEYSTDIFDYLLSVEHKNQPRAGFMKRQEDVTLAMRSILVDWLVEVAEEYKLHRETLFLTVTYIDRFLGQMAVLRSKLQLVGAAAMFLAAKYEEIYPPDVNEFVYITDDTYQKKQILRMEHLILKVLKFDLATPTINWFSERLLRKINAETPLFNLTMYLCELVLVENEKFLVFPSSLVAASAVCLANYTLGSQCWSSECESASRYTLSQLTPCVQMMYDMHCQAEHHPQQSIREKYRQEKYDNVAELAPQPLLCLM